MREALMAAIHVLDRRWTTQTVDESLDAQEKGDWLADVFFRAPRTSPGIILFRPNPESAKAKIMGCFAI